MAFNPTGLVTLLTDFGLSDVYVPSMKGAMLRVSSELRFVDLTHAVRAHNVEQGAFLLGQVVSSFPPGTTHLAVVDPGVGGDREVLCASAGGSVLLGPDNGLLVDAAFRLGKPRFFHVDTASDHIGQFCHPTHSFTFHGRDVFAPLAAAMATGRLRLEDLGQETRPTSKAPRPGSHESRQQGRVVHVDHFGNLITDISRDEIGDIQAIVSNGVKVSRVVQCYSQASPGDMIFLVGSSGLIEISRVEGSAAQRLGADIGSNLDIIIRPTSGGPHDRTLRQDLRTGDTQ